LGGEVIASVAFTPPADQSEIAGSRFLASYQPAWDEADEVIGVSVSVLDITESTHSEFQPIRGPELQSSLTETSPETPWVMDAEGNDLQVSSRWVRTTPLGKDKTRNLRWLEALHPEDLERVVKTMTEALSTGKPIDIEYRIEGVDGEWRWMRSTGSPRYGASGEITRWYGSVEDIHDRKQVGESIRESWESSMGERNMVAEGVRIADALRSSITKDDVAVS
jgi:PAS domain S-box-containing protein